MNLSQLLQAGTPAIVAILRGVKPEEVVEIGRVLIETGIRVIEVPLNSPEPLVSIQREGRRFPRVQVQPAFRAIASRL